MTFKRIWCMAKVAARAFRRKLGRGVTTAFYGAIIGVCVAFLYWPGVVGLVPGLEPYAGIRPLESVDRWIGDRLHPIFAHGSDPPSVSRIAIVGITESCIEELGEMPWDRSVHARLVRRLKAAGVRTIAFDIYFPKPAAGDAEFAAACREAGNVILPRWAYISDGAPLASGETGFADETAVPLGGPCAFRSSDGVFRARLHEAVPGLCEATRGQGHINVFYDKDALARRVPAAVGELGERGYAIPLGVLAALPSLGISPEDAAVTWDRLVCGPLAIPLDSSGCMLVNYCEPIEQYLDETPIEIRTLRKESGWLAEGRTTPMAFYAYGDVLNGMVPDEMLRDTVVLVGQRVRGSREDVHVTPYGSEFGVVVQAMVMHTALTRRFLAPISPTTTAGTAILLSILMGTICFGMKPRGSAFAVIGGGGLLTGVAVLAILAGVGFLRRGGIVLDALPFLMVVGFNLVAAMASTASSMTREAERRNLDIEMLLRASRRQISRWVDETGKTADTIEGARAIAMSASLSVRSPEVVAETFWQTVPSDGCVLLVMGKDSPAKFGRCVIAGLNAFENRGAVENVAHFLAREVIEKGEPVMRENINADWTAGHAVAGLHSCLGLPLLAQGRPIAVALLFNKRTVSSSGDTGFTENDIRLADILRYQATVLLENARRYQHEYAMFEGFALALAKAVDVRDKYTHGHSQRVAEYSVGIARNMGLSAPEVEIVQRAATLHDLGKIGVSDAVLNKPGKLSDEEFAMIRAHAANGYEILKSAPSFEFLLSGIRNHHERYDGGGYPDRLKGEEIPLVARIIAAADAYDAMTSDRIYRKALSTEKATEELRKNAGTQFDPAVVEAFLSFLEREGGGGVPLLPSASLLEPHAAKS